MTATGTAAYGMYSRTVALPEVVCALNRAGFGNEDICMVLSPAHPDAELVRAPSIFHRKATDGATTARMIEWFSKMGAVVIPTVGFFVRSNTYLLALAAEPGTATLSRGSRVLMGLGFSPDDAQRLGHQLSDFGALVYVSCPEKAKAAGVIELLKDAGAREAASLGASQASAAHSW
jgi:hypothetical protein